MSNIFNQDDLDLDETPDGTGEPPHPMGPWGQLEEDHEDLTVTEKWLGDVDDDA